MIKQLEAVSGVQLFERTTRRVLLSQAGEAFRPRAEAAVASMNRAFDLLRDLAGGRKGFVRIASIPSFVVRVLPKVLKEDRKSTRLNSSHLGISYAVFCLKK